MKSLKYKTSTFSAFPIDFNGHEWVTFWVVILMFLVIICVLLVLLACIIIQTDEN